MKKKSLLDSIDVPMPCDKSWDEMVGDDVSRFCSRCENDIYNISALTRQEAKKLLFQSNKKVCIRLEREPDGRIKTLKKQLHQITKQIPLATGVLSASLAFSTLVHAQEEIVIGQTKMTTTAPKDKIAITNSIISGTVKDVYGAVVAGAKLTLRNVKNDSIRTTTSNDNGFYEFRNVEVGNYEIEAVQSGFKIYLHKNIIIEPTKNINIEIALEVSFQTHHDFVFENPTIKTTEQPKLDDKIIPRQIVDLPENKNRMILGIPALPIPPKKAKNQIKTSQISFTIFDLGGAVIPNAEVKLINQKTQEEYTVFTNDAGVANFDEILRGKYELRIVVKGFQSYKQNIQIKKAIEPNIKIKLTVGTVGEVIFIKKD